MTLNSAYAILFCGLILFLLCPAGKLAPITRGALLVGLWIIVTIPLHQVSLAMSMRGVTGDLSIVTVYWLSCIAATRVTAGVPAIAPAQARAAMVTLSIAALILYPATLGLIQWDPYRLGYGMSLPLICAATIVLLLLLRQGFTAWALSLALLAYAGRLLESENLWDYLLDPWLASYALASLISMQIGHRRRKKTIEASQ
jgi:hypothetical protein